MSDTDETCRIIRRHIDNVRSWNIAALAEDYATDALMISQTAKIKGRQAIAASFSKAPPVTGLVIDTETYDGTTGLIVYHCDAFAFATDTFVVRDGQIALQTVAVQTGGARAVASRWAEHLQSGRVMEAMALLDPHVRYEIIGTTPLSGVYEGMQEFASRLMTSMANFPQPPRVRCETVVADCERAVVLGSGKGEGPFGRYDQRHYAWSMRVADGRIVEVVEFLDTSLVETAAFGSQLIRIEDSP